MSVVLRFTCRHTGTKHAAEAPWSYVPDRKDADQEKTVGKMKRASITKARERWAAIIAAGAQIDPPEIDTPALHWTVRCHTCRNGQRVNENSLADITTLAAHVADESAWSMVLHHLPAAIPPIMRLNQAGFHVEVDPSATHGKPFRDTAAIIDVPLGETELAIRLGRLIVSEIGDWSF